MLFGFAIDHSCLLWERKCDGSSGACLYYDNHQMTYMLLAVCVACKLLNIISGLVAWRLYVHKYRTADDKSRPQTAAEFMLAISQTGSGESTGSNNYGSTESIAGAEEDDSEAFATINPALELTASDVQQLNAHYRAPQPR